MNGIKGFNVTIYRATNGWIVEHVDDDDSPVTEVFEVQDDDERGVVIFADLLWRLSDIIGPATNRYDPARIYIDIRAGDKYEDRDADIQDAQHTYEQDDTPVGAELGAVWMGNTVGVE
jgi:hypothetical protein